MTTLIQWPGRCKHCHEAIEDWADAGLYEKDWYHKACFSQEQKPGNQPAELRSPVERARQLELWMMIFLLMFHFGLGMAVMGWIMITQGGEQTGTILLIIGIISPVIGVAGVALNVLNRHRIETIRQSLDLQGGWKSGR